jgi:hypothetical protein
MYISCYLIRATSIAHHISVSAVMLLEEICQEIFLEYSHGNLQIYSYWVRKASLSVFVCNKSKTAKKIFVKFVIGKFHRTFSTRSAIL